VVRPGIPPTTEADEAAEADKIEVEETGELEPDQAPERRAPAARWPMVAVGLAALFGLVASVMTASYIRLRSDKDTTGEDRTAVATVAAQLVEAMTAIDAAGDNQAEADVVHRLGTGPLIEQYDIAIPRTRDLLVAVNVQSERGQITPGGVYVGDVDADQAQVIVVIDLVVVGETTKVIPNMYLRLHLVKLNGEWKVDNLNPINPGPSASAGGEFPTTSVPTPLPSEPSPN